jgi:hypothetical protein
MAEAAHGMKQAKHTNLLKQPLLNLFPALLLACVLTQWLKSVSQAVPEPYLVCYKAQSLVETEPADFL